MKIQVKRLASGRHSTIGRMFIDGKPVCYTLEDVVREQAGLPVEKWKIHGETAIPRGIYEVKFTYSPKYKRDMLQVMDVPGFSGIRIHSGNSDQDTEGCILVGMQVDKSGDYLLRSRDAYAELMRIMAVPLKGGEKITIEIA
jgi:hypothetical protein